MKMDNEGDWVVGGWCWCGLWIVVGVGEVFVDVKVRKREGGKWKDVGGEVGVEVVGCGDGDV